MQCLSVYFCAVVSTFLIKGFFNYHGREFPSPYVNFQLGADLGMGDRQVGQGNALHSEGESTPLVSSPMASPPGT